MTAVSNTIQNVSGTPVRGVTVKIELWWDTSSQAIATLDADGTTISSAPVFTTTNSDGTWSADLLGNDLINPSGSLYKVTEGVTSAGVPFSNGSSIYYIQVSDGSDDIVANLLQAAP